MLGGKESAEVAAAEESESEFAADIGPAREYASRTPAKRRYMPWHKPRKQFVRRDQWAQEIVEIFAARDDGDPVRYLGLPGTDLLDLRYFEREVCGPLGRPLLFLGFDRSAQPNNSASTELNTSLDEVLRMEWVERRSDVLWDDFRKLGIDNSIAWKRTVAIGPFDVVNLDLMDGMASDAPASLSMYNAIQCLAGLQARRHHPWLLLLTTRIGRTHFDDTAFGLLMERLDKNIDDCMEFKSALQECAGGDCGSAAQASWDEPVFFHILVTCICKWLLALTQQPPTVVDLAEPMGYRVAAAASGMDMISLALRFEPVVAPAADPVGLGTAVGGQVDECAIAAKIPAKVLATVDVDGLLARDTALFGGLVEEMERLLVEARYDVSGYRAWLGVT
jgi:hypothetical protein